MIVYEINIYIYISQQGLWPWKIRSDGTMIATTEVEDLKKRPVR